MAGDRDEETLLRRLIRERDASYESICRELEEFAVSRGIDGTLSVRHLQRLARRERTSAGALPTAQPGTRRLLREFFGYRFEDLVAPYDPAVIAVAAADGPAVREPGDPGVRPGIGAASTLTSPALTPPAGGLVVAGAGVDPRSVASAAARDSLEFMAWAQNDHVPAAVLEHVHAELARIAVDYVHRPLPPLFRDLVELRDTTFGLLRGRPHPRQARELFFVAGTVCTLLAHASQNMGSSSAARTQAATAWACAEQADHIDLRAWVRGTQALIAEWSEQYDQAVAFSREGQTFARSADSRVRLASIEARTLARAGDVEGAVAAVERAERARNQPGPADDLGGFGGLLTFPEAKARYYAGSTLVLAGQYAEAERFALDAITSYELGPAQERSYGDEALARVDVAIARAADDDLEGAAAALDPVLALPAGQRIQQIAVGLARVRHQLTLPRYSRSPAARELTQGIAQFGEPDPS